MRIRQFFRLLIDELRRRSNGEHRAWASAYLRRQKRSEPRAYAELGRFRELSTLTFSELPAGECPYQESTCRLNGVPCKTHPVHQKGSK